MSNNVNWTGNRVLNQGASRPILRTNPAPAYGTAVPTAAADPPAPADPEPEASEPAQDDTDIIQGPPPASEKGYVPYYLKSNIGKNVRAEFIIGSSQYTDRTGKLIEVGINYFVLDDVNSRTHVMCDLYSVKFVTVLQE